MLGPVKLLVFAHTPPPHHGQSQMIAHLVQGFGGDKRPGQPDTAISLHGIEVYHVNARLSDDLEDIGSARWGKLLLLIGYCLQAIWIRIRYGVSAFYYVPSPPKRSSLYRDWMVMTLCRPWFRCLIFHWHSVGLGEWLKTTARPFERRLSQWLLGTVELSLVLSRYNEADARKLNPKATAIVPNGIPDPNPDNRLKPTITEVSRSTQLAEPRTLRVLFMALCTRDKGVHDAVEGVLIANRLAEEGDLPWRFDLTVAGAFVSNEDRAAFEEQLARPNSKGHIRHVGFLEAQAKHDVLRQTDLFCFPTYYANEGQPLNVIEAMAFGIPVVTTRWRAIPELFEEGYPGLIEPRQPAQVAEALIRLADSRIGLSMRRRFLERNTLDRHLAALSSALHTLEASAGNASKGS